MLIREPRFYQGIFRPNFAAFLHFSILGFHTMSESYFSAASAEFESVPKKSETGSPKLTKDCVLALEPANVTNYLELGNTVLAD